MSVYGIEKGAERGGYVSTIIMVIVVTRETERVIDYDSSSPGFSCFSMKYKLFPTRM